jgi:hypothetical protein
MVTPVQNINKKISLIVTFEHIKISELSTRNIPVYIIHWNEK